MTSYIVTTGGRFPRNLCNSFNLFNDSRFGFQRTISYQLFAISCCADSLISTYGAVVRDSLHRYNGASRTGFTDSRFNALTIHEFEQQLKASFYLDLSFPITAVPISRNSSVLEK